MPGTTGFSFVGIGVESTKGTAVAATDFIPVTSMDGDDTCDILQDTGMRGSMAGLFGGVGGVKQGSFSMDGDVYLDTIGYFLAGMFGSRTTTGAGPYSHTFTLNNDASTTKGQCPSYTIHDYNGLQARKYAAATLGSLSLRVSAQELFTYSAQFSTFASATESTPSPTYSALEPIAGWVGSTNLGGGSNVLVEELDLSFTRGASPVFTVDGDQDPSIIWQGMMGVSGRMMLIADDETEFTRYLTVAKPALVVALTQGTYSLTVTMTSILYGSAKIERGDDFTSVSVQFDAIANTTDAGTTGGYSPAKIVLVNGETGTDYD